MVRAHRVRKLLMSSSSGGVVASGDGSLPNPLHGSSKYKAYVQAVDRALKTFESPNEWADLISALGKLTKVFQSNAKFGDIPKPVLVAKRLSQCLHPALTSGVHVKALETYRQIFDILGPQLPKLLYLFAVGLFPLMDHCGIKVKSELFNLFEQYLVPLGENLRPALPGFLAGVLLGLEEGTEFYERSMKVLDRVNEGVGSVSFFACLWQAVLGAPSVRLPAMLYVNAKFDRARPLEDQIEIVGEHVNHMVAALCATAEDTGSPLVQRHLLDFLCAAFPLDSSNLTRDDFVQLLRRCLFVVLRRDMSLNRRLYTWLMNPTGATTAVSGLPVGDDRVDCSFYHQTVLPMAVESLSSYLSLGIIDSPHSTHNNWVTSGWTEKKDLDNRQFSEVRVCRLLTYLQDRSDIGRPLLMRVLPLLLVRCARIHPDLAILNDNIPSSLTPSHPDARSRLRLSLNNSPSSSKMTNQQEDKELNDRRIDENGKTLNVLLSSLEEGFVWQFLGDWIDRLTDQTHGEEDGDGRGKEEREEGAEREGAAICEYSQVVLLAIRVCSLDSDSSVRTRSLPRLLAHLLAGCQKGLGVLPNQALLRLIDVCNTLLDHISQHGAVELQGDSVSEVTTSPNSSPVKRPSRAAIDDDQSLVESCLSECLCLLTSVCRLFLSRHRSDCLLPLLTSVSNLVSRFSDHPIYCLHDASSSSDDMESYSSHACRALPEWVDELVNVMSPSEWSHQTPSSSSSSSFSPSLCSDLSARLTSLDLLSSIYSKSISVHSQHDAVAVRQPTNELESQTTTVLLKPLLRPGHLNQLESVRVFENCASACWQSLGDPSCSSEHVRLARLLSSLHSRKQTEASSDVEHLIVAALTNNDQVICSDAASTFHRLWALTRMGEDVPVIPQKPFNRAVMLLLGVLSDESVSRARSELKAVASAWFIDCAKHNDLPRIVQMLSTMLMNPVTARISIQYLRKESRLTRDQLPFLPAGVSAVTLCTNDSKQRVYHVDGAVLDGSWHSELRNRLLLSSTQDLPSVPAPVCSVPSGDVPNFDDDTDSLDTLSLSMEGVDVGVAETLHYLIDMVVEEEESEMEARQRLIEELDPSRPEGTTVMFRSGNETESDMDLTSEMTERSEREKEKAHESFSRYSVKKGHRRQDSLLESIFSMTEKELKAFDATEILRPVIAGDSSIPSSSSDGSSGGGASGSAGTVTGEQLFDMQHVHMLLYGESGRVVDLGRAETAFRILTALLSPRAAPVSGRMLLNCLVSSGTASQSGESSGISGSLVDLMAKHVRAILGQHFWGTGAGEEEGSKHRHLTLLELLITISLHFLRSYFLNSPISPVSESELVIAWKCKVAALDFLSELFAELSSMLSEQQSEAFVLFVQSILARAKFQKCLLHLLLAAVHEPRANLEAGQSLPLSVSISEFNEGVGTPSSRRLSSLLSAYHRSLLSLTAQMIRLESEIKTGLVSFSDQTSSSLVSRLAASQHLYNTPVHRGSVREPVVSLVELRVFLQIVISSLNRKPERHEMWLQFIVQILPWMERSLATVVVRVVDQLCKNVETATAACFPGLSGEVAALAAADRDTQDMFPANFITMTLETIITLVHYCVVDACPTGASSTIQTGATAGNSGTGGSGGATGTGNPATNLTTGGAHGGAASMVGQAISVIPGTKGATELFSNLVKVFSFSDSASAGGVGLSKLDGVRNCGTGWRQAKNDMLTSLPHALATICDVWSVVRRGTEPRLPLGTTQQMRRLVLDLLSPIGQHHQQALLQALSLVWLTRGQGSGGTPRSCDPDQPSFVYTNCQLDIANLLLSLKVVPLDELLSSVCETLKDAGVKASKLGPNVDKTTATFPTEVPLLEMVHGCISLLPPTQLRASWNSLHSLLSEAPLSSLPPRALFLLFIILCDVVRIAGASYIVEDKWMSRQVQDAAQRLTEAVNGVVGWQLETTTWLKRTLVVKHENPGSRSQDASPSVEMNTPLNTPAPSLNPSEQSSMRGSTISLINRPASMDMAGGAHMTSLPEKKSNSNLRGSVKDGNNNKRDPAHSTQALFLLAENLTDLMDSVCKSDDKDRLLPTLHAVWNNVVPYLRAKNARNARFFLASSQLLASMSSFNYMRPVWKKTTLELLLDSAFFRMDVQSLRQWLIVTDHLMTHDKTSFKDLLKSIAYTPNASFSLMTSKEQEYEARAQALKRLAFVVLGSQLDQYQAQMNDIQERLSENLRVSQSPSIRSAVFLCIRVLLIRLRPSSLVGIWPIMVTELVHVLLQLEQHLSGESEDARDESWMQLYLAACKLLETLCTLPSGYLAQFQMCHWAFVNSVTTAKGEMFGPFAVRINKLLKSKFGKLTLEDRSSLSSSLCGIKMLTCFKELRPFFYALATQNETLPGSQTTESPDSSALNGSLSYRNAISRLENALYVDFSDHLQL